MPEITRAEAVQERLRSLDQKLDLAIKAADALLRIKKHSEEQLDALRVSTSVAKTAEVDLQDLAHSICTMHENFKKMHAQRLQADEEAQAIRDKIENEVRKARREIDDKWLEVERRLQDSVASSNSKTIDVIKAISKGAERSAGLADAIANEVRSLVLELNSSVTSRFDELQAQFQSTSRAWTTEAATNFENFKLEVLDNYIKIQKSFQDELRSHLSEVDRTTTTFLEKQNVLIQNLTQHADGFERIAKKNAETIEVLERHAQKTSSSLLERIQELEHRFAEQERSMAELQEKTQKKGWFR